MTNNTVLVGHITQLLRFPAKRKKKKRKRDLEHDSSGGCVPSAPSSLASRSVAAWIFAPLLQDDNGRACCEKSSTYLLSVPHKLLKTVVDSCRNKGTVVRIHRYSVLPLAQYGDAAASCSRDNDDNDQHNSGYSLPNKLIEVHENGLQILSSTTATTDDGGNTRMNSCDFWTLEQVARREAMDQLEKEEEEKKKTEAHILGRRLPFSFLGTVAATSPVITMDCDDPFCMVELREEDPCASHYRSCIVVLRKDALVCQPAIVPGDVVGFRNASRRQWQVADALSQQYKLQSKVPKSVFVVEAADKIEWMTDSTTTNFVNPSGSICWPLVTVTGIISEVHSMSGSSLSSYLHCIDVITTTNGPRSRKICIFVTYFPMSTVLQLSLRPGATICASNVIDLEFGGYCACLQSHLVILTMASEKFQGAEIINSTLSLQEVSAYSRIRIKRSYSDFWYRSLVQGVRDEFRVCVLQNGPCSLPTIDDLTSVLLPRRPPSQANHSGKQPSRNAYAEFLDYDSTSGEHSCGTLYSTNVRPVATPFPLGLSAVQECSFRLLHSRLKEFTSGTNCLHVGWTAAVHLPDSLLYQSFGCESLDNPIVHTVGYGYVERIEGATEHAMLSNGQVAVPIVFEFGKVSALSKGTACLASVRIRYVMITCICIGTTSSDRTVRSQTMRTLPPYDDVRSKGSAKCGPNAIMVANGWMFMASFYILCDEWNTSESAHSFVNFKEETINCKHPEVCSVSKVLAGVKSSSPIYGILARSTFKSTKLKGVLYKGCAMTVSHYPEGDCTLDEVSTLQSMQFKPRLIIDNKKYAVLQSAIFSLVGRHITEEQMTIGLVWWQLSSSGKCCALLNGGWDECRSGTECGVVVRIPSESVQIDPKRGYVRLSCELGDLVASIQVFRDNCKDNARFSPFDSIGGEKFIDGMLDRRPRRIQYGNFAVGELIQRRYSGVGKCCIADLFSLLCRDLKTKRLSLAPSLMREIRGGRFLGISYCRALAECSNCYQTLRRESKGITNGSKSNENGGDLWRMPADDFDAPSFWDGPLDPGRVSSKGEKVKVDVEFEKQRCRRRGRETTPLLCPNRCRVDKYGAIKWECSGVLDDGTGQARAFAEREQAILLLGMDESTIHSIEKGAWLTESGIVYSKMVPPKPYLRYDLLSARSRAQEHRQEQQHYRSGRRSRPRLKDSDVLQFLAPLTCSEYLMQRHCRFSKVPLREINCLVRCKPLHDQVNHLKQTEIQIESGFDVPSYSLPPMKVSIVDCVASHACEE
jgi:hypothetical protein